MAEAKANAMDRTAWIVACLSLAEMLASAACHELTQTKPVHKYMISPKAVLTMQLAAFKAKMQLRHLLLHVPELAVRLTSSDSGTAPCSSPLPPGGSCRPLFLGYRENTMDT